MKVAISVPDNLYEAADNLAKQRQIPRSQLFADALSEYLATHSQNQVTDKLNQVYATHSSALDPTIARAQAMSIDNETW